eukprot:6422871-Prymnesium_polylepis.1
MEWVEEESRLDISPDVPHAVEPQQRVPVHARRATVRHTARQQINGVQHERHTCSAYCNDARVTVRTVADASAIARAHHATRDQCRCVRCDWDAGVMYWFRASLRTSFSRAEASNAAT